MSMHSIYRAPEHELLREQAARFVAREVQPHGAKWEAAVATETGSTPDKLGLTAPAAFSLLDPAYCKKYGVQYLTLYAFSTENWSRPKAEVAGLMKLLAKFGLAQI